MLGITQAIVNVVLYGGIALIFWYGPYLIRHECQNYTAGHFIVVGVTNEKTLSFAHLNLDIHLVLNVDIRISHIGSEYPVVC